MVAVRQFFANQFKLRSVLLESDTPADFYLSCWQKNRSALPLLIWRFFLFLLCLAITITSLAYTIIGNYGGFWIIYMTDWGIFMNTFATGMATAVSAKCYFRGAFDATFGLPWYVKLYWISSNIAITMALLITIFYWAFLTDVEIENTDNVFAMNETLNVFIHAINSVSMVMLLFSSRHETRFLHVLHPLAFGVVYTVFSAIYYAAGGTNGFGYNWIYPNLDWSQPGPAVVLVVLIAVLIIVIHVITVALAVGRNALARRCIGSSEILMVN